MEFIWDPLDCRIIAREPWGAGSIALEDKSKFSALAQFFLAQTGWIFLIETFSKIQHNSLSHFRIAEPIRNLITALYKQDKIPLQIEPSNFCFNMPTPKFPKTSPQKAVVAYSGGKDSLWNMMWAQKKYGAENVLAVHIHGLNQKQSAREKRMAVRQARELGFKNFRIVKISFAENTIPCNSFGPHTDYSYFMFIVGMVIPAALEFGASTVITEGYRHPQIMYRFNAALRKMGVPVKTYWRDIPEMEVVRELTEHDPRWLNYICTCLATTRFQKLAQNTWHSIVPTLPLNQTECGLCEKCRIATISRILYDPMMSRVNPRDIRVYLMNTGQWFAEFPNPVNIPRGEFLEAFTRACNQYSLPSLSLAVREAIDIQ